MWFRQTEHICRHLCHIYSVMLNQIRKNKKEKVLIILTIFQWYIKHVYRYLGKLSIMPFMTYHFLNKSNTTGATCGARTEYPSGARESPPHPHFCVLVRVAGSFVFCVVFCKSLFVLLSFFFGHCYCLASSVYPAFVYLKVSWNWLVSTVCIS